MARVFRAPNGYFYLQFQGKRRSLKTKDRTVAKIAAANIERRAADPTYSAAHETTVEQALKAFIKRQEQRRKSPGTMKMHDAHIRHIARVLGAETPLVAIDSKAVDHYLATRDAEGAELSTQGKELSTIRGTLRLAARNGQFHRSLESVMPHGFEVNYVPIETHLTLTDFDKLLSVLTPERAAVCAFIVATAADWKSVHAARRLDFNLKAGTALIRGSKNPHRRRVIPILEVFRPLVEMCVKLMPFQAWGNVRRDLEVACRRAKVTKITPRDLRRSHGSILRQLGVEPHLISKMMGHIDARMVERVYGQLPPDSLAALMSDRLAEAVVAQRPTPKRRQKPAKARSVA